MVAVGRVGVTFEVAVDETIVGTASGIELDNVPVHSVLSPLIGLLLLFGLFLNCSLLCGAFAVTDTLLLLCKLLLLLLPNEDAVDEAVVVDVSRFKKCLNENGFSSRRGCVSGV